MLLFVLGSALLSFCVYKTIRCYWLLWTISDIPYPKKSLPIIGNILSFRQPPEKIFETFNQCTRECGPIYKLTSFIFHLIIISSPEDVEIIISGMKNLKKNAIYETFRFWLKEGLLLSSDEKWHTRRRMLTPTFHFNILKRFTPTFIEKSDVLVREIGNSLGEVTDVVPLAAKYTFLSICETAMGANVDPTLIEEYRQSVHKMDLIVIYRLINPWFYFTIPYIFSPKFYQGLLTAWWLHKNSLNIIKNRKRDFDPERLSFLSADEEVEADTVYKGKKHLAMLDMLLSAHLRQEIDIDGVREEVDTFIFEGYDTTATCLAFTLMLLACNRDVQDKVVKELHELLPNRDEKLTFNLLNNMRYLEMVIKESLRLYPPVSMFGREISETIRTHDGYTLPAGSQVVIRTYDLHRNPDIYPEPEKFNPDRFLPEQVKNRHPFAYLPFSAGPRNCIGQKFALLELKALLSATLRNFEILPVDTPNTIELVAGMILHSKDGIRVKFVPRLNK